MGSMSSFSYSTLLLYQCRLLCYMCPIDFFPLTASMAMTEEKIDALLRFVEVLKRSQTKNQEEMARKLGQLES